MSLDGRLMDEVTIFFRLERFFKNENASRMFEDGTKQLFCCCRLSWLMVKGEVPKEGFLVMYDLQLGEWCMLDD